MAKKHTTHVNEFLESLEEAMEDESGADDFMDNLSLQEHLAMVPTPVIETLVNFIIENFGECAYTTFMEYFPINANAMMDETPLFSVGGVELVYTKPFKDLFHLMSHLHPDFKETMDSAINLTSTMATRPEGSMLQ
jgi:phosphoribosyl 1,2-cyclic phosphodiesterase